jgi:hypothetical protein
MTEEPSAQPEKPKKTRIRRILAWTGGVLTTATGGAIVLIVGHIGPFSPQPPGGNTGSPGPTSSSSTTPPPPIPSLGRQFNIAQQDAPITVTGYYGKRCDVVTVAPNVVVDADKTTIELYVTNTTDAPVDLPDMHVIVDKRSQPIGNPTFCGGIVPVVREFTFDLDQPDARLVEQPGRDDDGGAARPVQFPLSVPARATQILVLTATTESFDCTWSVELLWNANGVGKPYRIDDNGAPFRTMSTGRRTGG